MSEPSHPLSLTVVAEYPEQQAAAVALAGRLDLPSATDATTAGIVLLVTAERLELRIAELGGPVFADFVTHLPLRGGWRNRPLARAVGIKPGIRPRVVDASAGLGRDASLLAWLGCEVVMVERSPVIAALLSNALDRAARAAIDVRDRLRLVLADTRDYLTQLPFERQPDVVYLDPMYPEFDRSAQARKEMRVLRRIVGDDGDAAQLLALALGRARRRVVVKRPRLAPALAGPEPSLVLSGSSTRFDVYLR